MNGERIVGPQGLNGLRSPRWFSAWISRKPVAGRSRAISARCGARSPMPRPGPWRSARGRLAADQLVADALGTEIQASAWDRPSRCRRATTSPSGSRSCRPWRRRSIFPCCPAPAWRPATPGRRRGRGDGDAGGGHRCPPWVKMGVLYLTGSLKLVRQARQRPALARRFRAPSRDGRTGAWVRSSR